LVEQGFVRWNGKITARTQRREEISRKGAKKQRRKEEKRLGARVVLAYFPSFFASPDTSRLSVKFPRLCVLAVK
jgi:hypothetical protein